MAGSGKTALILKLLNSHTVRNQFSPIIWLCLSDINSKEDAEYEVNIVKFILCEMGCDVDKWTVINPSMPRLLKHLKNLLMSNKYLIVFDDVCENNEFYANLGDPLPLPESNTLSEGLPRDSGGRVIITSRLKEVVKNMVGEKNLIPMMPLSRESCRMIIEDDLFSEYTKKVEAFLNGNEYVSIGIYGPSSPANTNVARRVLSSPSVGEKFEPIIWVPISLIFMNCDLINAWNDPSNVGDDIWRKYNNAEVEIMKHVLKELGRDIDEIDFTQHKINYHELREMVERSLASKKYLIVLADVMLDNSDFWGRILSMWPTNGGGALIQICKSGELIDFADHLLHVRLPEWGSNQVEGNEVVIDGHYVSDDIVDQCAGLPFAANTMANLIIITSRLKQESDSDEASEHRNLQCHKAKFLLHSSSSTELKGQNSASSAKKKMAVRTNPEKAVPLLLKGLADAIQTINVNEDDPLLKKINKIGCDLKAMEHILPEVKKYEHNLLNHFANLKRSLRILRNYDSRNINSWLDGVDADITNIKNTVSLLQQVYIPEPATPDRKFGRKDNRGPRDRRGLSELEERILTDSAMVNFQVSYDILDKIEVKMCLLFLSIFPENSVIKKRPLIYWWIGEGLIKTDDEGERVFEELLKRDLIKPHFNDKSPIVDKCELHPWIRYMLISVAKKAQIFEFDSNGLPLFHNGTNNLSKRACLVLDGGISLGEPESTSLYENLWTIFNVNENYIDFSAGWLANLKKLRVLQLGRWQVQHKHHIEVQSEAFLKDLRTQKFLKYLSFRGISRITMLPPSIVELVNLEILDLKDCHNLETLPADIEPLRKLTHLDVSGCYLLESMPKGLEKLASLQVLKGFVIGNSKRTPCRIGDLKSLKKLKRLSIHIGSEAVIKDGEFDKLKELEHVKGLKISWGVVSQKLKEQVMKQSFSFPALEKLKLEGIPHEGVPDWLKPSKLKGLKQLYIKGGKLNSLEVQGETNIWRSVEILCLKYLKNLNIELPKVREMFPNLRYVLKRGGEEINRQVSESEIREEGKDFEWCKEVSEIL
ncbi:disease resistance RPP13-like protein 4 [Senna tora]|uniref:Disease resistance RPP13-like protein 4 n=1 Tax=Senna tora TaxID=362788 RepID=A0A834XLR1_9FABA|nr:disease resistance RPP13-like protein 4 [Senna tora]